MAAEAVVACARAAPNAERLMHQTQFGSLFRLKLSNAAALPGAVRRRSMLLGAFKLLGSIGTRFTCHR
eukprot:13588372-Alexandrium_andersonii.AAC.1